MPGRRSLGVASLVILLLAVIPTATGRGIVGYTWAGTWSTDFGPLYADPVRHESVEGTYTHDSGHMVGKISGSVVTGRWNEAPTRAGSSDAGP